MRLTCDAGDEGRSDGAYVADADDTVINAGAVVPDIDIVAVGGEIGAGELADSDVVGALRRSSFSGHKTLFAPHFIFNCQLIFKLDRAFVT